jgi:hypothetical protein
MTIEYPNRTEKTVNKDIVFANGKSQELMRLRNNGSMNVVNDIYAGQDVYARTVKLTSDIRFKDDIQPLNTLNSLNNTLNSVLYSYVFNDEKNRKDDGERERSVGFIAQELLEVNPHAVSVIPSTSGENERYSVNYTDMLIHLIGAIQETHKLLEKLESIE